MCDRHGVGKDGADNPCNVAYSPWYRPNFVGDFIGPNGPFAPGIVTEVYVHAIAAHGDPSGDLRCRLAAAIAMSPGLTRLCARFLSPSGGDLPCAFAMIDAKPTRGTVFPNRRRESVGVLTNSCLSLGHKYHIAPTGSRVAGQRPPAKRSSHQLPRAVNPLFVPSTPTGRAHSRAP